jgi:hypothetical protein
MVLKRSESGFKTKTAVRVSRFLTQKILRPDKFNGLLQHKWSGPSFLTLGNNEASNSLLTNIHLHQTDAFFRVLVVRRADCLPTAANVQRWYKEREGEICGRCREEKKATLAHILNNCKPNLQLMIQRHNRLAAVVLKAIIKYLAPELCSQIDENQTIGVEGLSEQTRNQRPDMVFERCSQRRRQGPEEATPMGREDANIIEMIEFSCPYGRIANGQNTLELTYRHKHEKYTRLVEELKRLSGKKVRLTVVIISSMGAVWKQSLKDLQKLLKCDDRKLNKLGREMSEVVIKGSMEIWRRDTGGRYVEAREEHDVIRNEIEIIEEEENEGKQRGESEERSEEENGRIERDAMEEIQEEVQGMEVRGLIDETNDEGRRNERNEGVGDNEIRDREGQAERRHDRGEDEQGEEGENAEMKERRQKEKVGKVDEPADDDDEIESDDIGDG